MQTCVRDCLRSRREIMGEARACDLRVRSFVPASRIGPSCTRMDQFSPTITCEVIKIHEGRQDKLNMRVERPSIQLQAGRHFPPF